MKALVTGFEPFGGERVNPSGEAIRRLPAALDGLAIATQLLPAAYAPSLGLLHAAIARERPDIVLCTGEAGSRLDLTPERVAINVQDARIPDNDGAQPIDLPVVEGGPAAYFTTLPIKRTVHALRQAGLPASVSNSAGAFVCNHVFYGLMHHAATRGLAFRGGFMHLPYLPEQAANHPKAPSMALADIVRGIEIVLGVCAAAPAEAPLVLAERE
jgi:pyroglutamyl-peptidase